MTSTAGAGLVEEERRAQVLQPDRHLDQGCCSSESVVDKIIVKSEMLNKHDKFNNISE